jgi:hypothetical protein
MEIPYKIPKINVLIYLAVGIFILLIEFKYFNDSFNLSSSRIWLSVAIFIGFSVYFYITPKDRKIVADEDGISVPRISFPPYKVEYIKWDEIIEFEEKESFGNRWHKKIILRTKDNKYEIKNGLCASDYILWLSCVEPYNELKYFIIARVSNHAKNKYLFL